MTWTIEPKLLGAAVASSGVALVQFGGSKWTWWVGIVGMILGPFLLAMRRRKR